MTELESPLNVLILGSGPAGLTAAIYTARANLNPVLVYGREKGGQLMITSEVENYPGFPQGIKGPEMMDLFTEQANRFETRFLQGDVVEADLSSRPFSLILEDGKTLKTNSLIIATGASARWLGLDSEKKYNGRGVSACATCDGFFFRNQNVAVVGGGDTAMEEALYLANLCEKVTVIHRRDELRASKIMQERALKNPKIAFLWNSAVEDVLGDEQSMNGLSIKNLKNGELTEYPFDGMFVAIGHTPNTQLFEGQLDMDENGYLKVRSGSTFTSNEGVFACGDVQDHIYRQAVTASGTGCMAAIDAERWLAEQTI
ncbi:MAG: thioredoxin-disulfide reductase [SAR324 cluster bacterium]|jgi:thioredoxin reductase (NADPH)|nr:thioredoxin-disulfide reductase [Pseudomonadota bacterium]MDP6091168.1 thioredoxin-disulfide reductase [SAR324 cluster bacterium]MEE1575839.1 thioredoxin-disulfide reductase [Deltaproteobacteria bacterium]MDP7138147.1 thioredoxin-disulfide reductase [SAR324 cluster bacterium]MDP7332320.1 thioredoxin-disulfide reductase [SAR324 cluster bacterium]|tara:strand:+ start:7267 stop:8211 length:945 start_codon:yes stop_codon:yes gene_type:complete